jgi:hypothetical protein
MEAALAKVSSRWDMRWLDGKDHSFAVTDDIGGAAGKWLGKIGSG